VRIRHSLYALLLSLSWLAAPAAEARAAELASSPRPARAHLVVIESRLDPADDAGLRQTLSELLGRLDVRLAPAGSLVSEPELARVTISPTFDGARVTVQPLDPPGPLARHEVPQASSPELFRETLAHVVLGAIEPLVEQARAPEPARLPPAPIAAAADPAADRGAEEAPAEPHRPTLPLSWWVGARASALWFVSQGRGGALLGGAVGATVDAPGRAGLALEAGYLLPLTI
jgi:hypothetical protein